MGHSADTPERLLLDALYSGEFRDETLSLPYQPGHDATLDELRSQVRAALKTVSYRERGVLEMRFGLGDGYAYTLAEAGYVFRLTRERIRQIQLKALRKVKHRAGGLRRFLKELETR